MGKIVPYLGEDQAAVKRRPRAEEKERESEVEGGG
jgi:hypothetical protein